MNDRTRTIRLGYGKQRKTIVRIETPFGIITVQAGLVADNGRDRIRVDVGADGDRYCGDPPKWWIPGNQTETGVCGWLEIDRAAPPELLDVGTVPDEVWGNGTVAKHQGYLYNRKNTAGRWARCTPIREVSA